MEVDMFKKILVPLDGSELAAKIIPQVIDLAKTHRPKSPCCMLPTPNMVKVVLELWLRQWPRRPSVAPPFSAR